ncbi:MAG: DegT/DnrJ/EryC1/StrS family aminotransferase [Bacteroidota bacterium]|nr:DegT/DnrJ/EryC1/StrS family aminotransferase [Bacteroidota bacterium]
MNIPFSVVSINGNELKYITEVLESGWLTTASKTISFEKKIAEYVGAKFACAVNSCTAALHLAVEAVGIGQGDKVLVPSLTFTASAEVLRYVGADPVLIDVDYGTGLITPAILKDALKQNSDIKALILVHYAGQAAKMVTPEHEGILDICRQNNIKIIEDAAHAFPTKCGSKYIGSYGDVTCFSFYANKTITTGEGGMLLTDNEEVYKRVKIMRLHGINRDIWNRFTSDHSSWEYDVVAPGFKYNMPDLNAAVGLAQLERAEYFRAERQRCAEHYYKFLSQVQEIDLPICYGPHEGHAWHLFPIIIRPESGISRNDFINQISERGIGVSVHYKPIHHLEYYRKRYNLKPDNFPNTEKIWKGTVSLPIYPELNKSKLDFICDTIKLLLKR